jgi:hypothetical protein
MISCKEAKGADNLKKEFTPPSFGLQEKSSESSGKPLKFFSG